MGSNKEQPAESKIQQQKMNGNSRIKNRRKNGSVLLVQKRKGQIRILFMNQSELNFLSSSFTQNPDFHDFLCWVISKNLQSWVTNKFLLNFEYWLFQQLYQAQTPMKKNVVKCSSPEQEYFEQGFGFTSKQVAFKRKSRKTERIMGKKFPVIQVQSEKLLNTVSYSPRRLFFDQYELTNRKRKCFFSKNKNSNSGVKSHDCLKINKSKQKQIRVEYSPVQMERNFGNQIKLPLNIIKPTLLNSKQNVKKKSKSSNKALDKYLKEYAVTVGVVNPEGPSRQNFSKRDKEKKTLYRTESLASLSRRSRKTDLLGKVSTECSHKDSNTGESTASHLSNHKKEQKPDKKNNQTLINKLKISECGEVVEKSEVYDELEMQGYEHIEQILNKLKVLALYSQGIVESYEDLDEWEQLIFLVYKKYYLERKKLVFALKAKEIKYFSNFFEGQTLTLKGIWKFMKGNHVSALLQNLQEQNKTILASLRNLYNLAIEKSGVFINMNEDDNFHQQILKLLSEEIQSLEILLQQNAKEVTNRLRKNLQCAKTLCQINGMRQWKVFSNLMKKPVKKALFWKVLQYYGTLL